MKVSIVILTYNRRDRVEQQLALLSQLSYPHLEIIIVDNASDEPVDDLVALDPRAILVRNTENLGAVGRNSGLKAASGEIAITLDDDVSGITDDDIVSLCTIMKDHDIAAVNFKIIEDGTNRLINWCHPYDEDSFSNDDFDTYEISEGAVALKMAALKEVGFYPDYFFISHEGPDLAFRLINAGFRVVYRPDISVTHAYDQRARVSWRRYYYDTRNQLWFVLRNLSFSYGFKRLFIGWCAMLVYSIRDGFFTYWCKAVIDAFRGAPLAFRDRQKPTKEAQKRWQHIAKNRPGFWKMVAKRLFKKEVRI